ncbi:MULTISPECIES: hypothetical protein [Pseudomonas]
MQCHDGLRRVAANPSSTVHAVYVANPFSATHAAYMANPSPSTYAIYTEVGIRNAASDMADGLLGRGLLLIGLLVFERWR